MLPDKADNYLGKISNNVKIYKRKVSSIVYPPLQSATKHISESFSMVRRIHQTKVNCFYLGLRMFIGTYLFLDFVAFPLVDNSLHDSEKYQTEYQILVKNATLDNAGIGKTLQMIQQMINKGKKNGLLSIQISQLAYLLEPQQIAWQGKYLASLKS